MGSRIQVRFSLAAVPVVQWMHAGTNEYLYVDLSIAHELVKLDACRHKWVSICEYLYVSIYMSS